MSKVYLYWREQTGGVDTLKIALGDHGLKQKVELRYIRLSRQNRISMRNKKEKTISHYTHGTEWNERCIKNVI